MRETTSDGAHDVQRSDGEGNTGGDEGKIIAGVEELEILVTGMVGATR